LLLYHRSTLTYSHHHICFLLVFDLFLEYNSPILFLLQLCLDRGTVELRLYKLLLELIDLDAHPVNDPVPLPERQLPLPLDRIELRLQLRAPLLRLLQLALTLQLLQTHLQLLQLQV
jgi:hypothetical protein